MPATEQRPAAFRLDQQALSKLQASGDGESHKTIETLLKSRKKSLM